MRGGCGESGQETREESRVNGRDEWAKFAAEHSITWEEGPARPRDQHGNEYDTFIWAEGDNARLMRYLKHIKYVVVRMFPQTEKGLVRMRLGAYLEKPA